MIRAFFYFSLLLLPLAPIRAEEYWEADETSNEGSILQKKEVLLFNENLHKSVDSKTGVVGRTYFTGHDEIKFYAMGHISEDLAYARDLLGIEAGMAKKIKWFWAHLFLAQQGSKFDTITENRSSNPNSENPYAEENNIREGDNNMALLTLGLGLGVRSRLRFPFPTERFFQMVTAYFTYSELDEGFRQRKYLGPGMRADYALEHRVGNTFYYAPTLTYNFAIVSRQALGDNEINNDRRLYLSYLTLGLNLGLYF